jgi:hypothetical protein
MDGLPPATTYRRAKRVQPFARSTIIALLAWFLILARSATSLAVDPMTLGEYQIKAGFLFNFTRFVTWPEKTFATAASPIVICVVGDTPLTDPLIDVAAGKIVDGHSVSVKHMKAGEDLRGCNLLFISSSEQRHAVQILDSLKGLNVLTVGEDPGVARAGAIINFTIQENKVKLEINLDAAMHTSLKLSAKLIEVSRIVSPPSDGRRN